MVKPNISVVSKPMLISSALNEALLNKANWIVQKTGKVLDLTAEAYKRTDGTKSESHFVVTAKNEKGVIEWTSVQLLCNIKGKSALIKAKR